jgi:hypothetical protein
MAFWNCSTTRFIKFFGTEGRPDGDGFYNCKQEGMDGILELQQEIEIEIEMQFWYCSKSRWRCCFKNAARPDKDGFL